MKKKILALSALLTIVLLVIFSCTMIEKCCGTDKVKTTAGSCGNCGKTSCTEKCSSNTTADSTKIK